MKTIFLTSGGVKIPYIKDELLKFLPKPAKGIKLAHIITASKVAESKDFVEKDKKAMDEMGFQVEDIDIEGKSEEELRKNLLDKDIIYVQGGNGFYLLKHAKESGFDRVAKELIDKGKIYVGVSAGSYIACPTIEMHNWKSEKEKYGVTDLTALNLVPFLVTVHYNRVKYREGIKKGMQTASHPVKILTDYQALLVQDDKVKLVGVGSEILAEDVLLDTQISEDEINMELAVYEAKLSQKAGGAPIGAVLVKDGKLIATGQSLVWPLKDPSAHGETQCLRNACQKLDTLDLSDCTLYSTLESCSMCLGCAGWCKLSKIVFGAFKEDIPPNPYEIEDYHAIEHAKKIDGLEVVGGVLREECSKLMENIENWSLKN